MKSKITKAMKRALCYLLVAVLVLLGVPNSGMVSTVYADGVNFASGSGTVGDPYIITTAEHLNNVRNHKTAYFRLGDNINLNVEPYIGGWVPIGDDDPEDPGAKFAGHFDGNGHTVSGLYVNREFTMRNGLFGYAENATIRNLNVSGDVIGWSQSAILLGNGNNVIIDNVNVNGAVSATIDDNDYVGGIAGYLMDSEINEITANVSLTGFDYIGGIAGFVLNTTIEDATVNGTVTAKEYAGGIIGQAQSDTLTRIESCINQSAVNGTYMTGGIVGYLVADGGTVVIDDSRNNETITSNFHAGGIVGYAEDYDQNSTITVTNNINVAPVRVVDGTAVNDNVGGGIIGHADVNYAGTLFTISDNENSGAVTVKDKVGGGILGNAGVWANGTMTVSRNINSGEVTAGLDSAGGLGGEVWRIDYSGTLNVIDNINEGNVSTGRDKVGGLFGSLEARRNGTINISKNLNQGNVIAEGNNAGGIIGYATPLSWHEYASGTINISNNYNLGGVEGEGIGVGGIIGFADNQHEGVINVEKNYNVGQVTGTGSLGGAIGSTSGTVTVNNVYYDSQTSGQSDDTGKGTPKTTKQMKQEVTFTGWDFDNDWDIVNSETHWSYPHLKWQVLANVDAPGYALKSSNDASLTTVADLTDAAPGGGDGNSSGAKKTWIINVLNNKETISLSDVVVASGATKNLYTNSNFTDGEITGINTIPLTVNDYTDIYVKVTAANETTVKYYQISVFRFPALIAYYDFNGDFTDYMDGSVLTAFGSTLVTGRNNSLSSFGVNNALPGDKSYWQWQSTGPRGGGFTLDINTDISASYTIGLRFSYEQTGPSWKKIIDYKNLVDDTGFYFNSGNLKFYNYPTAGTSVTGNNQIVDLIVTRTPAGNFIAYIIKDGVMVKELEVDDSIEGQSIPEIVSGMPRFGFFHDDSDTPSEATSGGKVYSLKIWDGALPNIDVSNNPLDSASPVAILSSVASQTASTSGGGNGNTSGEAITWSINVPNNKASIGLSDIVVAANGTKNLYTNSNFTDGEVTGLNTVSLTAGGTITVYIKITSEDTTAAKYYAVTINRAAGGGDSSTPALAPVQKAVFVIVNGQEQNAGIETRTTHDGKSTVTVEVNNQVIKSKIEEAAKNNPSGLGNIIQVPVSDTTSEVVRVVLTGDIVKKLEDHAFDVSVKRDNVEYIIPAEEFTILKVAENLDVPVSELSDIKIEVRISRLDQIYVDRYEAVAKANNAELVFPPVAFEIVAKTTKSDGTTADVSIDKFSNYVERIMEIPAGVDPSKITTGIVFNPDGTYSHVPTEVFQKDGKWYAKLNSLTNSNYSVIWNPITVKTVENHWSKDAVNDMASRLVVFNADTFVPDKAITRADFAEYIIRALGLYREGSTHANKFSDVKSDGDRTLAILIANEYGIVTGYPDGSFRPDAVITREEAMAMYQRAMKVTKLTGTDSNRYQNYTDFSQVGGWATSYVKEVLSAHVFNGNTATTISPKSNLTYAEAAQAIKNLLVESKLINK